MSKANAGLSLSNSKTPAPFLLFCRYSVPAERHAKQEKVKEKAGDLFSLLLSIHISRFPGEAYIVGMAASPDGGVMGITAGVSPGVLRCSASGWDISSCTYL